MTTQRMISRRAFLKGAVACAAISSASMAGCSSSDGDETLSCIVGTMPTEDILPLWVAEQEGLFASAGIDVTIESFDSASALSSAITAGEVDVAMTDVMRSVKLCASGTMVSLEWVTLGTEAEQGRFGVLTSADSGYTELADLVGCTLGVGVASNTVPEYVFDKLCEQAGIDPSTIATSEVASLPSRYTLVSTGALDAAALPGSMLALGEAEGLVVLADDTTGDNISQSVMVAREAFRDESAAAIEALRGVWDEAVELLDAHPESYRTLLIENANISDEVADSYPISSYPYATTDDGAAAYPAGELVEPQLAWMEEKGYTSASASYDEETGCFTIA